MAWSFFGQQNQQQNQQNQQQQNSGNQNRQNNQNNNSDQNENQNQQQQKNNGQQSDNQNANPNEPKNPLDVYGKMFDNPSNPDAPPSFAIDPKVMDGVVGSQDFMQGINPELMQKATSGDVQSMMEIIQHTSRSAYRAAIEHGGVLTDKFVGAREAYGNKTLPNRVREELTTHALSDTPNFQHPVVKKQLTEIAKRLQTLHPDASPQDIAKQARTYLTEMANAIKESDPSSQQQTPKETNWDDFFNDPNS